MAISQARSKRKKSGGRYRSYRKKKLHELGRGHIELSIGKKKVRRIRGMGSTSKQKALLLDSANVLDPKTKKFTKAEILAVKENPANPHYVRRNTITKGAIIETKAGMAKVVNRPGKEGMINAILIASKKE